MAHKSFPPINHKIISSFSDLFFSQKLSSVYFDK